MNESPGWASPGSFSSEPSGSEHQPRESRPGEPNTPQPDAGWSQRQPPPVTSSSWGSPPGPGPEGQGSQGPHHAWHHPPTPKPGVVPLRPLNVGEILDGAVSTIRFHWRPALGISLGIALVLQTFSTLVTGLWFREQDHIRALENARRPTAAQVVDAYNQAISAEILPAVASLIATVLATAMLTMVVSRAVLGRPVSVSEAWQDSRSMLPKLLGLSVLVTSIVLALVLAGILPGLLLVMSGAAMPGVLLVVFGLSASLVLGIWLWVRLSLAAPALMLEKQGILAAMRRSTKLVKDSWWRVFGIQALVLALVMVVAFIVAIATSLVALILSGGNLTSTLTSGTGDLTWPYLIVMGVGAVVASTLTLPFAANVTALLYIDRRIRREALDLELARAAGVPGYGENDRPLAE